MRIAGLFVISAATLATGCDNGAAPTSSRPTQIAAANPYHDRLQTLAERDRSLALRRAVQDAGESCRRIETSGYQAQYKGMRMWTAACTGGRSYAIFIAANGDVQVRNCADATTLGLPGCTPPERRD